MSLGIDRVGAVVSMTITFCNTLTEFDATSVAVQVTTVSPSANTSGASFVSDITPTASETKGSSNSTRFKPGV